jgi:hypothetical protein
LANAAIAASRVGAFHCDEYHEMSGFGGRREPVHSGCESAEPPNVCTKGSEMNMTTATDELRELRDDELEAVSGGLVVIAIIAILIGLRPPAPPTPFPHNPS